MLICDAGTHACLWTQVCSRSCADGFGTRGLDERADFLMAWPGVGIVENFRMHSIVNMKLCRRKIQRSHISGIVRQFARFRAHSMQQHLSQQPMHAPRLRSRDKMMTTALMNKNQDGVQYRRPNRISSSSLIIDVDRAQLYWSS